MADARAEYFRLMEQRPELFQSDPVGIRLVTDEGEIAAIEAEVGRRIAERGFPAEWAGVGLHYQDPYVMLVRDAVVFPDGSPGIHHRLFYRDVTDEASGVGVLAIHDGRLVLLRHYRHAIGGWSIEMPRGGIPAGLSPEQAARQEIAEEVEGTVADLVPLGFIHGSTALVRGKLQSFFARLDTIGQPQRSEGIVDVLHVAPAELEAMIADGRVTDSFTICAFTQARTRGLV